MSVMVIACYRPKPGKQAELMAELRVHLPVLRREGLVGDGPSLAGRAKDGTIVEIFCWKSQAAIDAAHANEAVGAVWARFADICDFVTIGELAEAAELFSPFEPIEL